MHIFMLIYSMFVQIYTLQTHQTLNLDTYHRLDDKNTSYHAVFIKQYFT